MKDSKEVLKIEKYIINFNNERSQLVKIMELFKITKLSPEMDFYSKLKEIKDEIKYGRKIVFREDGERGSKRSIIEKILEIKKLLLERKNG